MAISSGTRWEIFRRDGFRCRYCGRSAMEDAVLEVDHVQPRAHGGGDEKTNLVTACRECNGGKSATPLRPIPQERKLPVPVAPGRARKAREVPPWPELIEEGAECLTPLRVAMVGVWSQKRNYAQAWDYTQWLAESNGHPHRMPPYRQSDARWMRVVEGERETYDEISVAILNAAMTA